MKVLAVDIGNAETVLGVVEDGEVLTHWRLSTDTRRTPDEWSVLLAGAVGDGLRQVDDVAVCSAVPSVLHTWRELLDQHRAPGDLAGRTAVIVGPGVRTGLPVHVDNPREVGTDRICNAVAVAAQHPTPAIVVDSGTALTFDVVDAAGRYVGGVIAAEPSTSLDALARRGAQLRAVELAAPRAVIAKNTVEALQSGAVHGTAALVDGIVARIAGEWEIPVSAITTIATGTDAELWLPYCRSISDHEPWLTLQGLALVFARNQ